MRAARLARPGTGAHAHDPRRRGANVTYVAAPARRAGLSDDCADVVLAVQALHWMEPAGTFAETRRILRPGGVFVAIHRDWPSAVGDWIVEQARDTCRNRLLSVERQLATSDISPDEPTSPEHPSGAARLRRARDRQLPEGVRSWSKSQHLARMQVSGVFAWSREIVRSSVEDETALGSYGSRRAKATTSCSDDAASPATISDSPRFEATAHERLGPELRPWRFQHRARLGFLEAGAALS